MKYDLLLSHYINQLSPLPTSCKQKGTLEKEIRCVLFDIYGTLFISGSGDISTARKSLRSTLKLEQLLLKYGIRRTVDDVLKDFFTAIKKKHEELMKTGVDYPEVEIDRIWKDVLGIESKDIARDFAVEFELIANPVYPMPHLKEMLSAFRDRKIPMGIISNAQFYTPYLFNWFLHSGMEGLGFEPDLVFFSYRLGYAKPSMFLFRRARKKINKKGIPEDSVLYVGNDMRNDIHPAKKIGFATALFAGDARSLRLRSDYPGCKDLSADLVITDLIQLAEIVLGD